MKYSPRLKLRLLNLVVDMRNHLSRKLQHFINMLLIPHPKVGLGKTEVRLLFNNPFMKDRSFTVSVSPNERSTFKRTSNEAFR